MNKKEWLTPKEAAPYINSTIGTLATWRCTKEVQLPYEKAKNGRIKYHRPGLDLYKEQKKQRLLEQLMPL